MGSEIMFWLQLISDSVATLARLSIGVALLALWWRTGVVKFGWPGRAMLVLLICGGLLHIFAGFSASPALRALSAFFVSVALCAFAAMLWPMLKRVGAMAPQRDLAVRQQKKPRRRDAGLESRAQLELAEQIAHVGHWRYSVADDRIEWSDEMFRIFGVTRQGYRPEIATVADFICPNDREDFMGSFRNALQNGEPFETQVKLRRTDGAVRHATVRGIPQLDAAGTIVSIFGVFVDVTGHKQLEEALHEANRAGALANRALEEMAMQDGLTGLPNRRAFDAAFATEFKRAAREKAPLGLIMIDLDYFKSFNDRYGHPAGDDCLRRTAEAIAGVPQRPGDMTARYGGEEMVILLPNTNERGARAVAQLILRAIRDLKLPHASNPAGIVTVSCGVAAFTPDEDAQVAMMLLERADRALYCAKIAGRNQVASHMDMTGPECVISNKAD